MLMFLLAGYRPEIFGKKRRIPFGQRHRDTVPTPLVDAHAMGPGLDLERLSAAEFDEYERLLVRLHELEAKAPSGTVTPTAPELLEISTSTNGRQPPA